LGQTYSDFEIIVIDDGSTDNTREVVTSFDDDRIKFHSFEENIGLPTALNKGIEYAQGEFIARADADEYSRPRRLEKQVDVLERDESTHVVGCWYQLIGRDDEPVVDITFSPDLTIDIDYLLENGPDPIVHGAVLMRKSALEQVGNYREEFTLAQDYDLWIRMAETFGDGWIHFIPEILYDRRLSGNQIEKRERTRLFKTFAKEGVRRRRQGKPERLSELAQRQREVSTYSLSDKEVAAMYHYIVGIRLLEQQRTTAARWRLLTALWYAPTRPRPWYKFILSFLSPERRSSITNSVESIVADRIR
jgi:glycosyltransferase involved in cell wall biosynthesis